MSDRSYRFILGLGIVISLFLELHYIIYLTIAIMLVESITNYRIPLLINRFKSASVINTPSRNNITPQKSGIEAERLFRLIVAAFISLGSIFYPDTLWFFPWFVGLNLLLGGITGICPLVMMLKKAGFK